MSDSDEKQMLMDDLAARVFFTTGHKSLFFLTSPEMRTMGFGTGLVSGLLDWARENGALHAYLQIEKRNALGIRLDTRLGFQEIYQYWYRVPEDLVG